MSSNKDRRTCQRIDDGVPPFPWQDYIQRFETGAWRSPTSRDMIASDIKVRGPSPVVLDIGCGRGFDDSIEMQTSLAAISGTYIGVEPDATVARPLACDVFHQTTLEQANITPGSVDVAFATFVIEHVPNPEALFSAVESALAPGGVFWAMTIDARSPFAYASPAMQWLGVKDRYLDRRFGVREERHLNYPTVYDANTPARLQALTRGFRSCEIASLHCVGIIDILLPKPMRPLARFLDRATLKYGWPGANLAVRTVR